MVHLVSGKNHEGYMRVLLRTWLSLRRPVADMPAKSALTQIRSRISYQFFEDAFRKQIADFEPHRPKYRGCHIYAIDGDQMTLPQSPDILRKGYRGYPCKNAKETYYPRMYVTHAVDVVCGVTKDIAYSTHNNECEAAVQMARSFEKNSITLYDRLHLSGDLIRAHHGAGNHLVARCRRGATFGEVVRFFRSRRKRNDVFKVTGITVRLIKIKNPKTKRFDVFATTLPKGFLRNREIRFLYVYRWEAETCFRDFTSTMKAEQWHSKSMNGILQEFFTALWLMNFAKIEIAKRKQTSDFMKVKYTRANFKLVVDFLADNIGLALRRFSRALEKELNFLVDRSTEKRKKLSRSKPRQLRSAPSRYPYASLVERRA